MINEESFGERKARERAERKRQIRKEKELKALERAMNEYKNGKKDNQPKEKPIPKVEWLPKIEPKPLSDTFDIDWEDNLTVTASDDLFKRIMNGEDINAQILKMPPGTGKTAVIIRTLGLLQESDFGVTKDKDEPLNIALVLPPNVYKQGSWLTTIGSYNYHHRDNQLNLSLYTTRDKFTNLLAHPKGFVKFINEYNFAKSKRSIVVIDEIHGYKNPVSKRSKQLQRLPNTVYRLGLSGTPLTNDEIIDGSSYLVMSGLYSSKTNFLKMHGLTHMFDDYKRLIVYDRNTMKVNPNLYEKYPQFLSELGQVIFTPEIVRNIQPEDVGMPTLHEKTIQLDFSKQMSDNLTSLKKAYQKKMFDTYTDVYMEIVKYIHEDVDRLDKLVELVKDERVKQPLIFYKNTVVLDVIVERFKQEGIPIRIINSEHKYEEVDKEDLSPIIIQYYSGSEAIEFKHSNTTIMYQHQPSTSVLEQARKRNVRRNMFHDEDITLYYIVADNFIDQAFYSRPLLRERVNEDTGQLLNKIDTYGYSESEIEEEIVKSLLDNY